ncbi:hypothetical protein Ancab_016329 [Ancistrocladus abbreviatus]
MRIPLHSWSEDIFKKLAQWWGTCVKIDNNTIHSKCFDYVRFAVHTASVDQIRESIRLKVDDDMFLIHLVEEFSSFERWLEGKPIGDGEIAKHDGTHSLSIAPSFVPETMDRDIVVDKEQHKHAPTSEADEILNRNNLIRAREDLNRQPHIDVSPKRMWEFMAQIGLHKVGEEEDVIHQISEMEQRDAMEYVQMLQ